MLRHIHDGALAHPPARAQARLFFHDFTQQLVCVKRALHKRFRAIFAHQFNGACSGCMTMRTIDDLRKEFETNLSI